MTIKSDASNALPEDHASKSPDGPWSVSGLPLSRPISELLSKAHLVDIRDVSRERLNAIKGVGPKSMQTIIAMLENRLAEIVAGGTAAPDASSILDGTYRHPSPNVDAPKRRKAPRRQSMAAVAAPPAGKDTVEADHVLPSPTITTDEARSIVQDTTPPAVVPISDVKSQGTAPDQQAADSPAAPLPEAPGPTGPFGMVEVSGGRIIVEEMDDGRIRVLCHDRFMLQHVGAACAGFGGIDDGTGWIVRAVDHAALIKGMRSSDLINRLRKENQTWNRKEPTHRTPRGDLHIHAFEGGGKRFITVRSHPYSEVMARRLDVVCPALGGKWNALNRSWSLYAHQQAALLRSMEDDAAPGGAGNPDDYAVPERTFVEAGLEYASVYGNKPDLDWYEAKRQTMLVETPKGTVEIVRVNPETWIARKPNSSRSGDVNAQITAACGTMMGDQGNWHPPFAGRRFPAAQKDRVLARLREQAPTDAARVAMLV